MRRLRCATPTSTQAGALAASISTDEVDSGVEDAVEVGGLHLDRDVLRLLTGALGSQIEYPELRAQVHIYGKRGGQLQRDLVEAKDRCLVRSRGSGTAELVGQLLENERQAQRPSVGGLDRFTILRWFVFGVPSDRVGSADPR